MELIIAWIIVVLFILVIVGATIGAAMAGDECATVTIVLTMAVAILYIVIWAFDTVWNSL